MARPAGIPLLLLLPFILGCCLSTCHANVIKEEPDTKSVVSTGGLKGNPNEEVGTFRKIVYDEFERTLQAIDQSYVAEESCEKLESKILKLVPAIDPVVKSLVLILIS